jgi:hypothetical protein
MRIIIPLLAIVIASCQYKKEPSKTKSTSELKWLLTGLPDELIAENIIAKIYGFQFFSFGGCVVSNQLRDSINKENKKLYLILSKKYSKSWKINFDKRVKYIDSTLLANQYKYQ